jgi:hypothetical protein
MSRHVLLGRSMSALKDVYRERATENNRKRHSNALHILL